MIYTEFKDKDGNPVKIRVEYEDSSWCESIETYIIKKKMVNYFFFWEKERDVNVHTQGYRLDLNREMNCDLIKSYATRTLEDYNNRLTSDERRGELKELFEQDCK